MIERIRTLLLVCFCSCIISCSTDKMQQPRENSSKLLPTMKVNAIAELPNGNIAFGTDSGLLIYSNSKLKNTFTGPHFDPVQGQEISGNSLLPNNAVVDLITAADDSLWIATRRGLARYNGGKIENISNRLPKIWSKEGVLLQLLSNDVDITRLFKMSNGCIVIGSRNAGIILYDPKKDQFKLLYKSAGINKWVTAFAEEKNGDFLIAVIGHGLFRYDGKTVKPVNAEKEFLSLKNIRSLCIDSDETIWLGTHDGVIAMCKDGKQKTYTKNDVLPDNCVWDIVCDKDNRIWFVTFPGIATYANGKWQYPEFKALEADRKGEVKGNAYMTRLYFSKNGDMWLGTFSGVLHNPTIEWKTEHPVKQRITSQKKSVEENYPNIEPSRFIVKDKLDRVWLATEGYLLRYDGKKWDNLTNVIQNDAEISFVKSDSKGRILIGASGDGLLVFDGDKLSRYNNDPEHAKSVIYDAVESPDGIIYLGTQYGLYSLNGTVLKSIINHYQVFPIQLDNAGRIWFGDFNAGLIMYDGKEFHEISRHNPLLGNMFVGKIEPLGSNSVRVTFYEMGKSVSTARKFDCDGSSVVEVKEEKNK